MGATPDAGSGATANTGNMTRPILRDRIAGRPDYRRLVLLVALFGAGAASYPVTVPSASLPRIADDLGATDDTIARVIAAPLSTFAVATPIAEMIGDL